MEEKNNQENKSFSNNQPKEGESSGHRAGFDGIIYSGSSSQNLSDNKDNLSKFSENNNQESVSSISENNSISEDNIENKSVDHTSPQQPQIKGKNGSKAPIVVFLVIILAIIGIWYLASRDTEEPQGPNQEESGVNINVDNNQQEGKINIITEEEWDKQQADKSADDQIVREIDGGLAIIAYYNNLEKDPGLMDCSKVYPLERIIEDKYSADAVSAVIGLLRPLSEVEKQTGWNSAIPAGTYLMEIKIESGTADVYLAGEIASLAGSCAVTAARAQIEQTLKQFSYVDEVNICVNSNCRQDEILQP